MKALRLPLIKLLGLLAFALYTRIAIADPQSYGAFGGASRHWVLLALVLGWVSLIYVPQWRQWSDRAGDWVAHHPRHVSTAIGATFLLLVALGTTGSSLQLLSQSPWNNGGHGTIEFEGQSSHLFIPRGVRSDEWMVLAPNTLAQWNHNPPFPITNKNLGLEGQNMGVIGMTGVPIAQPAAIARPATWGYFFLPLEQALSWHWQFPFFACLFFLWKALNLLSPRYFGFNLLLSVTFCVQPYAAGWSLWPLYAAFFPLALFVIAAAALKTDRLYKALFLGTAIGILLSGWVLLLYPPWQITLGSFFAVLAIGWLSDHWRQLQFRKSQWLCFGLALLVAAAVLGSWWLDTADAIEKIQATVYPGARTALQGADIINAPWWTLRGYLNPEALPFGTAQGTNQSEISSYILFPIPVVLLGLWFCKGSSTHQWTMRACMVFIAFWFVFRFFGIPLWMAKISLWSHVNSIRLDLSMGLASTVVMGLAYAKSASLTARWREPWPAIIALCVAIASAALVWLEFSILPPGVLLTNSFPLQLAMLSAVGCGSWWMISGRMREAACLILLLCLASTLAFNPLSRAPRSVKLSPASALLASDSANPRLHLRTLVISNSTTPSMMLAAVGVPTIGGVLYYPHRELWQRIGLAAHDWPVVNRYQHLTFSLSENPSASSPKVSSFQPDTVNVALDPTHFDFSTTGARRVAAPQADAKSLKSNPYLTEIGQYAGLVWFAVHEERIPAGK